MSSAARSVPQQYTGENQVPPIMGPGLTYRTITEKISDVVLSGHIPTSWFVALAIGLMGIGSLSISAVVLLAVGTGVWGVTIPTGWGFAIINFVWWIGIGHAGTLISAVLHLLNQQWRTSINRFAEAMTLVAVLCAGMFPLLHTGRPWLAAYWLRFESGFIPLTREVPDLSRYLGTLPLVVILSVVSYKVCGLYQVHRLNRVRDEMIAVFKGVLRSPSA